MYEDHNGTPLKPGDLVGERTGPGRYLVKKLYLLDGRAAFEGYSLDYKGNREMTGKWYCHRLIKIESTRIPVWNPHG